jgi:hypothetical protein
MVFFIPLLGLRVSQFNGEKFGATPDPTQKTITNFIRWTNKNQFGGREIGSKSAKHLEQ